EQVKIRGCRIELGEIEAALARHAAVREAVVVAREDVAGDKRLVAYIRADKADADLVGELRAHLRASLLDFMMPAALVFVDSFPLNPNAKLDRKALPAPERSASGDANYVAPRTPNEDIVAG